MAEAQGTARKPSHLRRLITALICMFCLLIGLIGGYIAYIFTAIDTKPLEFVDEGGVTFEIEERDMKGLTDEELGIDPGVVEWLEEKNLDVTNVLLLGFDRRSKNEVSRTDTMMIASLDRNNEQWKLTSLMRDMQVSIPGKKDGRINIAYPIGGAALAIATVNDNFRTDIRSYIGIDFAGLEAIINALGGIEVDLSAAERDDLNGIMQEINDNDSKYKSPNVKSAGVQTLNGRQAVCYARIRHVGNGDFQRTERQRYVLSQILEKSMASGPLQALELLAQFAPYIETNLTNAQLISLAKDAIACQDRSVHQFRLPVEGAYHATTIDGNSVLVPDIEKNAALLEAFIYNKAED